MLRFLLLFFGVVVSVVQVNAQAADSLAANNADSIAAVQHRADSAAIVKFVQFAQHTNPFTTTGNKPVRMDVQQWAGAKSNAIIFAVLVLLLLVLTYVKAAFGKDLEELLQSFINRNIALQIFRTRKEELTFSSFLLHLNFIVVMGLYVRFVLIWQYHVTSLESFSGILFLIFLFTFFYLIKIVAVKFLGTVFEAQDVSDEYIFNFSIVCKTLGLALIPALFIFYTAPIKYFNFIFPLTGLLLAVFVFVFVARGLSTGYKFLYRSVYHFFIYVCVVEVSPIFLLFKLLTKTVV